MHAIDMREDIHALTGARALLRPQVVLPLRARYRRAADKIVSRGHWMPVMLAAKRAFDIVGSLFLLVLLSPIILLCLVLIPLDSPGNPIFSHERIGLHGRTFRILKFRTMRKDAHAHREHLGESQNNNRYFFKHYHDPRVTRLGQFLRKFSLDELPQLVNVLRGDMSLIGPRPLLKEDFVVLKTSDPLFVRWVRERHQLWPGLTGLWQVNGRSALPLERSMELDLAYIEKWSPKMDAEILLKTIPAILRGSGAY
jgi:lipopolysaccharide/colanic/teichoic acid biosynthesis glycosyltransferase